MGPGVNERDLVKSGPLLDVEDEGFLTINIKKAY